MQKIICHRGGRYFYKHVKMNNNCALKSRSYSTEETEYADIIIAGGGMVGTSLACALGNSKYLQNKKVILLEAAEQPLNKNWKDCAYENRVSAITPGSKEFFVENGIWNGIEKRRYNNFTDMQVWDGYGAISLNAKELGFQNMAYMIENAVIVESCSEVASSLKGNISIEYNAKINKVNVPSIQDDTIGYGEDLVEVCLENGNKIKSKLLVGADGYNSFIRNQVNLKTYDYDYQQSAVVATLSIQSKKDSGNSTAWQRFLKTGPIALLPMSNSVSSLVWSTQRDDARELMKLSEEEFIVQVNKALTDDAPSNTLLNIAQELVTKSFFSILKPGSNASNQLSIPPHVTAVEPGSRGMFPLGLKHAPEYVKSRTVLVGDAAHRIHPMAGQGVNLGFGDVKCLVRTIEDLIINGKDIGSLQNLLSFETERQRHVVPIILAINGLNSLFSTTFEPVAAVRALGLNVTNSIPLLKEQIVSYAMK